MLRTIHFQGYRSLRDFRLRLGRVTVVTGENGVGKSNVYRALEMVQRMAQGRFAAAVAGEGGLPSLLWAGELKKNEKRRVSWTVAHEDFHLAMECGMIPATPGDPSLFKTDPDIKSEELRHAGAKGKVMVLNEPESSLHRDLLGPLAELIAHASGDSQILIVTHSTEFAELISEKCEAKRIDLINHEGKTLDRNDLSETGGKVWHFGD